MEDVDYTLQSKQARCRSKCFSKLTTLSIRPCNLQSFMLKGFREILRRLRIFNLLDIKSHRSTSISRKFNRIFKYIGKVSFVCLEQDTEAARWIYCTFSIVQILIKNLMLILIFSTLSFASITTTQCLEISKFPLFQWTTQYHHTVWKVSKYGVFFWSVFSRIRTEYGELWKKSPYSVQIRENTDQKKLRIWTLFTQCQCWGATIHNNL